MRLSFCAYAALLAIGSVSVVAADTTDLPFKYLELSAGKIRSTHDLPLELAIPADFTVIEAYSYEATFHDHPFNVTVAAMYKQDFAVLAHAERLADNSGYLDYSYLTPTKLDGIDFFVKEHCATLDDNAVDGAPDLNYLKAQGFDFAPSIYLKQYFKNTEDGNAEFVLSVGHKVADCNLVPADFVRDFDQMIERYVDLRLLAEGQH